MAYGNHPSWYRRIVRAAPVRLEVTDQDGKTRTVKVPDKKRRWAALWDIIGAQDWAQIDGYDQDGNLVVSMAAEVAQEQDQDQEVVQVDMTKETALLEVLIRAQESAMSGHEALVRTTMEAMGQMVATLSARLEAVEAAYWQVTAEVARMAQDRADNAGSEADGLAKMVLESIGPAVADKLLTPGPGPKEGKA